MERKPQMPKPPLLEVGSINGPDVHQRKGSPQRHSIAPHPRKSRWGLEGPCQSAQCDKMEPGRQLGRLPLSASLGQAPWAQLEVPGAPRGQ